MSALPILSISGFPYRRMLFWESGRFFFCWLSYWLYQPKVTLSTLKILTSTTFCVLFWIHSSTDSMSAHETQLSLLIARYVLRSIKTVPVGQDRNPNSSLGSHCLVQWPSQSGCLVWVFEHGTLSIMVPPFSSDCLIATTLGPGKPSSLRARDISESVLSCWTSPSRAFLNTGTNLKASLIFPPDFWPGTHNILSFRLWFTSQYHADTPTHQNQKYKEQEHFLPKAGM